MENTKIQTLWNMCLELKDKRQSLLEQWRNTQHYLDSKQTLIENEFQILRQNNSELAEDVDSLYTQLDQFRHFWKSYFGDVVGLQQSFAHLGGSYQELNGSFGQLYSELAHLSEDIKAFTSRSDASSDELEGLRTRFAAQQQKLQETYAQYQAQKDHLDTLNQEKSLQQDSITSLQGELTSLHGHFSELGSSLQSFHQELGSYREKWQAEKAAHLQAIQHLETEHSDLKESHEVLQTRHTEVQADHARLHKEHVDLTASHTAQTEVLKGLETELAAAQKTLTEAADLSQTALVELAELRKAVSEVDQAAVAGALVDLQAQVAKALSQSADLTSQLAELRDKQAETLAELDSTRAELETHKSELTSTQSELEARSSALETAQSELKERSGALEAAQAKLESAQAELAERALALEASQAELETAQDQLAERSKALSEAQAATASAQAELSAQKSQFESDTAQLESDKAQLEGDKAQLESALKVRSEDAEAAQATLSKRELQMAGFIQGFADLREAHAQLKHQIEVLQGQQAPMQEESALLKNEQDELRQKLAEQENQLKELNTQVHDSSEEVGRKEKLMAQLESYGEESDAIRSARTELVEELKAARTRLEGLTHKQEQASKERGMLFQALEQTSESLEQKQQELKQAELELRYRQEHLEQLEAFLSGLERAPEGPLNLPDLDAPAVVVEVKEVNVADPALQAQLQVAEAQVQALQAALEEKEAALEQALQQSAVDHLLDDFAAEVETLNEADLERQADIDLAISEEVEQISSLLSEINFGASQAFEGEGTPELSILDLDDPAPVASTPPASKAEQPKPEANKTEAAATPAPKAAPVVVIYSRQVDRNPDWDQQLRSYLDEYACSHHWLTGSQQPDFGNAIKGLVFLLEPAETINENLYQEAQRRNIPFIKHYVSNITRLKIDILDAFIR